MVGLTSVHAAFLPGRNIWQKWVAAKVKEVVYDPATRSVNLEAETYEHPYIRVKVWFNEDSIQRLLELFPKPEQSTNSEVVTQPGHISL